ncbi:MAG TPA: ABC transporter substrate-binding protein, partial [bacterium]|nr:ABC transporter substrate-binding protein [bacterium]
QAYGWERGWQVILSLAGNTRHFSASASQVARATSLGDVAVALCIDSYALAQIQVNGLDNLGFVLPEGLTVINPDGIGILKGAPNLTTACRFIDFLLSSSGQLVWMLPPGTPEGPREFALNRLSIRPETYQRPGILFASFNPYQRSRSLPYNFSLAARRWGLLNDLLGSCVIDPHAELSRAWHLLRKTSNKQLWQQFYQLPLKPAAQRFFWENWSDPVFRNQYLTRWLNFSREKFTMVARQIQYLYP